MQGLLAEPDPFELAARRLRRPYQNLPAPGSSNMEAVANALIPTEPWEYAAMAAGPGGRIASMLPKAVKGGLLALGLGTTATEAEAGPAGIIKKGLSLASNPFKKPPAIGGYHGTSATDEFSEFKKSSEDLGTHFTVDPDVSHAYSNLWKLNHPPIGDVTAGVGIGGPRTVPIVADIQSALKFPKDALNWKNPENVMGALEDSIRRGANIPRGMLSDFEKALIQSGGWENNWIPMLQEKGYDSLYYPHESIRGSNKYNAFMALDPKQVVPRYSPEGFELIAKRGVVEPIKNPKFLSYLSGEDLAKALEKAETNPDKWRLPRGILRDYPNMRGENLQGVQISDGYVDDLAAKNKAQLPTMQEIMYGKKKKKK